MRSLLVKPASCLRGEVRLLGDKSIAHRAVILSAITPDKTIIKNFPNNQDCFFTIEAFKKLGIKIIPLNKSGSAIAVFGKGLWGLRKSRGPIFLGESGTTFRLMVGLLAAQGFSSCLTAAESLSLRPMLRVIHPLRMMGAVIKAKTKKQKSKTEEYPPVTIKGSPLKSITYRMPVASAQVKSAILLAGLYAQGSTQIIEPIKTRDHSERMLKLFKAGLKLHQNKIVIKGNQELVSPKMIYIPADISSAGFFIVLAALLPDCRFGIKNVSLNPSRLGLIKALKRMGAQIQVVRRTLHVAGSEPIGEIIVKSSQLKGIRVKKQEIPTLIDELPILMVAASLAYGRSLFEGIEELRVKETDRIRSMSQNLKAMGARISILRHSTRENMEIKGVPSLSGAKVKSFGDHRTAMSMVIAGLLAQSPTFIDDLNCINKSFPDFLALLKKLVR